MAGIKRTFIAILAFAAFASPANAGVLLVSSQSSPDAPENGEKTRAYIAPHAVRIESSTSDKEDAVIFRGDRKVLWVVDQDNKTVTEITQEDLRKMAAQVQAARKQIQEQLKNLPPGQRAMMERMMKDRMPATPEPTVFKKTGESEEINGWTGEKYVGMRKGEKESEIWTASADQLGISADDMVVMQDMAAFFREFSDRIGFTFYQVGSEEWEQGYSGIPIRMTSYVNGKPGHTSELVEVREENFDDALFELPSGYTKKSIPIENLYSHPSR